MRITQYGAAAAPVFGSKTPLPIHSVFRRTVNILWGERIIAIHSQGVPVSPVSICTSISTLQLESIFAGCQTVIFSELGIHTSAGIIRLDEASQRFEGLYAPKSTGAPGKAALLPMRKVMAHSAGRNSFFALLAPERIAHAGVMSGVKQAADWASQARRAYMSGDIGAFAERLGHLCGLGQGLTPAGDDFLIGILGALDVWNRQGLRTQVANGIHTIRTTAISAEYLYWAIRGRYAAPMLSLMNALSTPDRENEVFAAAQRLAAIGHTSGCDMMSGFCWMQSIMMEDYNGIIQSGKRKCLL